MCPNALATEPRRARSHHCSVVYFILVCVLLPVVSSISSYDLYPFDLANDSRTPIEDDGGSDFLNLPVDFPFYNHSDYRGIYVNNNGIISFLEKLDEYRPTNFDEVLDENKKPSHIEIPLISPYWSDVDIAQVRYQLLKDHDPAEDQAVLFRVTEETDILQRFSRDISQHFFSQSTFRPLVVVIVTWYHVGFYGADGDRQKRMRNTFQAVLGTDSVSSYAIFNYLETTWTTGSNSEGTGGLGGHAAVVGFNSGRPGTTYLIPESGLPEVINVTRLSNIGVDGKFIFKIDGPAIKDDYLSVHPRTVGTLGREHIRLSGPFTGDDSVPRARFVNKYASVEFSCVVESENSAVCVTPSFFYTGPVTLEYNPYGTGWDLSTTITLSHITESPSRLVRENVDRVNSWRTGKMEVVSWDPDVVPEGYSMTLEVVAYTEVNQQPSFSTMQTFSVADGVTSRRFKLLTSYGDSELLVIRLCYRPSDVDSELLSLCIWSDVFAVQTSSQDSEQWCKNWLERQSSPPVIDNRLPNCSCVLTTAETDSTNFHVDPFCDKTKSDSPLNCIYQPKAQQCMRRKLKSPTDHGLNCCYDGNGELMYIRAHHGAGTHQLYDYQSQGAGIVPFFSYFRSDLLPKLQCCQYSDKLCKMFSGYRQETSCTGYSAPSPAQAAGDPHLVTLDGRNYSFNGVGDFVLVQDSQSSFVVQVRAVPAENSNGTLQNATVFSSVAVAVRNVTDVVEIRKQEDGEPEVLVNGLVYQSDSPTSQLNGITLQQNISNPGNFLVVLEPVSASVTIEVTPDLMNIIVLVGEQSLKGNLQGLLGNYNGIKTDEFIARGGTQIPNDAQMSVIHYDFGMTWAVSDEERLLVPVSGLSDAVLHYTPVFIDSLDPADLPEDTLEICGDNLQCQFDYSLTRKKEAALELVNWNRKFETLQKTLSQTTVRCPYLDVPTNGNRTLEAQSVGSLATFTCDTGSELLGTAVRECLENGTWSGADVLCVIKTVAPEESSSTFYTYIGASMGATVFLLIIFVIVFYMCRKKRKPPPEPDPIPNPNIPMFENQAFMERLQGMVSEGVFRIPRPNYVDPNIFQEYF